jgi:xanthine permease XanP
VAEKPAGLIYGVDDTPPPGVSVLLGVQHVFVMTAGWIMVVVIVTTIGGTEDEVANVLRMSMIASGIATILQSLARSPVGSGYFCPISSGPAYESASMLAGKAGGLALVSTLTLASGVFEGFLSRIVPCLRALFPPEVTGLVVTMVGVELITLGSPRFLGFHNGTGPHGLTAAVGALTRAAMIGPTVWGKGKMKLYPLLIGLAVGCVFAHFLGEFPTERVTHALAAPMFSLPRRAPSGWAFDADLLPAFLIASLASTLKSVGDLTLCQRIFEFMEAQGGAWGARRDVVMRAAAALEEFRESAAGLGCAKSPARAEVSFDEFNLDVDIRYDGELLDFPSGRPTADALLADGSAVVSLSGFLIRQYADRITADTVNGRCHVHLHFDH